MRVRCGPSPEVIQVQDPHRSSMSARWLARCAKLGTSIALLAIVSPVDALFRWLRA